MASRRGQAPSPPETRHLMAGRSRPPRTGALPGLGRFFGRRRTYLIDTSYQIRTALIAVLGMAFLVAFAAALFHLLESPGGRPARGKAALIQRAAGGGAEPTPLLYLVAAGAVFVAAVFVIEILETHKTAGVVLKVTRGLREIGAGRWGATVALRRHDNFREMEEAFNAAAHALRDQIDGDLGMLQGIEGQIRLIGREFESGNREGALVLLRQVAGELQSLRERKRNLLGPAPDARSGSGTG